ncbi:response regulator [Cohnella sp. AR92]|uniref:response regulator transcription factor n=1 Tax=Cohnella sp. AR92 TaxID=648716 RepID=UPI000F8DA29A|nr:response regulator [Cohnella sp. AR92]RUS46700.1 response regulator [Cohnella sp. AR92]
MALQVMLVDDELLVRLGVKSLIDWEKHGFEFIGDAADGEKALELMKRKAPDILLTDIVMPNMNGLELIERVKKRYPDMAIIVLSSHNEFEYVRRAMKLGVEDYLLKTSLKPAELLALLIEASDKVVKRREGRAGQPPVPEEPDSSLRKLTDRLLDCLEQRADEEREGADAVPLPANHYLLALHMRRIRDGVPERSAAQLLKHLAESELGPLLATRPESAGDRDIVVLLKEDGGRRPDLERIVSDLAGASSQLLGISLLGEASGPLEDWREAAKRYALAKEKWANSETRSDIKQLLDYLRAHLARNLSLREAAERINMSESYLSTLFKRETGTGFTDWINLQRVERAADLLTDTDLPSYLIAEQVGYENINYFGRIFKKLKGVSPQKYRARHQALGKRTGDRLQERKGGNEIL